MKPLSVRYEAIQKLLSLLDLSLKKSRLEESGDFFDLFRDATIHRFKLSVDAFVEYLKGYLDKMGVAVKTSSPIAIFDECLKADLISKQEFEALSSMLKDYTRIPDAYTDDLAQEIYLKIPQYYDLMKNLLGRHSV